VLKSGDTFSYVRPAPPGSKFHEYVEPGPHGRSTCPTEPLTTLDVGQLAAEVKAGVQEWVSDLLKPENAVRLATVERHLTQLAREKPKKLPAGLIPPGTSIPFTNSSS
jgi:hypothetical protein